jgi:hypothetical protein
MPKQIQDEFTNMDISRQRRYQLRHEKRGLCRCCTNVAVKDESGQSLGLCARHQVIQARTCANARKPGHDYI